MKICFYTKEYENELLGFLTNSEYATIGHLPQWIDIFDNVFNYKSFSLVAFDSKNEICGFFPLFLMKNILLNRFLISSPFNNFSGILYANDIELYKLFLAEAKKIAQQQKTEYLEIRQLNENIFQLPERSNFVSMFLDLTSGADTIWKNSLNTKVRNQVRKSEQNNLFLIENDSIENFYAVYCKNMRDLGSPSFPFIFFKQIKEKFKHNCQILSVSFENKIIASMFVLKWRNFFSDPWASSLREYNYLNPNNFLYWNAIKMACHEDYTIFDMGRSTIDTGTYHFKKQWGSKPIKLNYQYIFNRSKTIPVVDAKHNKYEMAIQVWKKLPLNIANLIGTRLIKYLPEL